MKELTKDIIFVLLLVSIISLIGYVIFWTQTEGGKCVSNSFLYSANNLQSSNGAYIECSCSSAGVFGAIIFNKSDMWAMKDTIDLNYFNNSKI